MSSSVNTSHLTDDDIYSMGQAVREFVERVSGTVSELRTEIETLKQQVDDSEGTLKKVVDGNRLLDEVREWRKQGSAMVSWIQPHKNDYYQSGKQADANCSCEACTAKRRILAMLGKPL